MSDFRMDEAGLFLERQLEYIRPQVFEVQYADIKYPTILPVTSEAGPGAQTFTYRIMDATGEFKVIADAADDLPRADISQTEKSINIRSIGGSFGYTGGCAPLAPCSEAPPSRPPRRLARRASLLQPPWK